MRTRISAIADRLRRSRSTALEVAGLTGTATSVGHLAGPWWGVLSGSVSAVIYGIASGLPPRRPPSAS